MITIPLKLKSRGIILLILPLLIFACQQQQAAIITPTPTATIAVDRLKIQTNQDGLYKISREELDESGFKSESFGVENLALFQRGQTVPFRVIDDSLIFYAETNGDRYVKSYPLILESGVSGSQIQEQEVPEIQTPILSTVPQLSRFEENHKYTAIARTTEGDDVWFWQELRQQETFDTEIDLQNIHDVPATLRINAWGVTYNRDVEEDHDFDLIINDKFVDTVQWDGQEYYTSATSIPSGILKTGLNTITLDNRPEGASFLDIMDINWLDLEYHTQANANKDALRFSSEEGLYKISGFNEEPIVIDITEKNLPKLLTGWNYSDDIISLPLNKDQTVSIAGPEGFLSPDFLEPQQSNQWVNYDQQTDLLIIAPRAFIPSLRPLVTAREAEGLTVTVVPVNEIYDEFGGGAPTPYAIQTFIANALNNWQLPRTKYLLLVGDATTDYLGNTYDLPDNTIPSLLVPVQFSGETVSDSRLADIDDDMIPDIAVGRWPVRTKEEVEDLVKRTIAYENGTASNRALFAVDDSESQFSSLARHIAESSELPDDQVTILDGLRASDIAAEMNGGAWVTTYVGHGSINRWGKDDVFTLDSVEDLNLKTPPIILQMTCLTGLFSHPEEISLSEAMLTQPAGPVSIVAATSLTLSAHQEPFAIELLEQLQDPNINRIGDAFQNAKLALEIEKSNGFREISDTFALLGDPSARIVRPNP